MVITKTFLDSLKIKCPKCKENFCISPGWYYLFMIESNEDVQKKYLYDTLDFCKICGSPIYVYLKETYPLGYLYPYHQ
jgi:phage FluMu protein Com